MGEILLKLRRTQLSLNYWVKLKDHIEDHPTQAPLKHGWEIEQKAKELEIMKTNISPVVPRQ